MEAPVSCQSNQLAVDCTGQYCHFGDSLVNIIFRVVMTLNVSHSITISDMDDCKTWKWASIKYQNLFIRYVSAEQLLTNVKYFKTTVFINTYVNFVTLMKSTHKLYKLILLENVRMHNLLIQLSLISKYSTSYFNEFKSNQNQSFLMYRICNIAVTIT